MKDTVRYEVWFRDIATGELFKAHPVHFEQEKFAQEDAAEYNTEEKGNSTLELRPVRRQFVVVEAVTSRKVIP